MSFNILIVDDSKVVHAIIEKTLRMAEIPLGEIHHASNGQEGLEMLEAHWVDLIFADINMPVMTGDEMIERMAANNVTKSIPTIVVSTEGSATRVERLNKLGVAAFLRKPFKPEEFASLVRDILGKTHA
ncbi:MAG: response regulator [bacterium]|nr:response regulator [bacterium]